MRNLTTKGNTLSLRNRKVRCFETRLNNALSIENISLFENQFAKNQQTSKMDLKKSFDRLNSKHPNAIKKQLRSAKRCKPKQARKESQSFGQSNQRNFKSNHSKLRRECSGMNGKPFEQEYVKEIDQESTLEESSLSTNASVVWQKFGFTSSPAVEEKRFDHKMMPYSAATFRLQAKNQPNLQLDDQLLKLKSLKDKRKKEEFILVNESSFKKLFKHPSIKNQKLIEHTCDNDYPSDEEQVELNKKTLKASLEQALSAFVKKDPLVQIQNLADDFAKLSLHSQLTTIEEDALMAEEISRQSPQKQNEKPQAIHITRRVTRNQHILNV